MVFPLKLVIFHSYVKLPEGSVDFHLTYDSNIHLRACWFGTNAPKRRKLHNFCMLQHIEAILMGIKIVTFWIWVYKLWPPTRPSWHRLARCNIKRTMYMYFGAFLKEGCLQIIHFHHISQYKPFIWDFRTLLCVRSTIHFGDGWYPPKIPRSEPKLETTSIRWLGNSIRSSLAGSPCNGEYLSGIWVSLATNRSLLTFGW